MWRWIMKHKKNILKWGLGILLPVAFAASVPVVPVAMEWVYSGGTALFDTSTGWVEEDQYARVFENGDWNLWIHERGSALRKEPMTFLTGTLTEVHHIGLQFYDVFNATDGTEKRQKSTETEYRKRQAGEIPQSVGYEPIISSLVANAAVWFDATTTQTFAFEQTKTWTHTTAGEDRLLTFLVGGKDPCGPTAVSYDSVNATQKDVRANGGVDVAEYWVLHNPRRGANTASVTLAGFNACVVTAASWRGARQYGQPTATSTYDSQFNSAPSREIFVVQPESAIVSIVAHKVGQANGSVPGAGQFQLHTKQETGANSSISTSFTYRKSKGNVTMSWTLLGSDNYDHVVFEIAPAPPEIFH